MAVVDDMPDWPPGAPAPWLAAYGAPPIDPSIAGLPSPAAQPPPAPVADPATAALPVPVPVPVPYDPTLAGAPGAPPPSPDDAPPWLQQPPGPGAGPTAAPAAPAGAPSVPPPTDPSIAGAPGAPHSNSAPRPQDFAQVALDPDAPIADRQRAWQSLSLEQRTNIVNTADPKQLAAVATSSMSPEEAATITVRHQQAQLHEQAIQELKIQQDRLDNAGKIFQLTQAAAAQANTSAAQVDADARRVANEKIDPNEHGVGHFVASVITSALGGAMSQYTGGRNLALEELDKQTQRRIAAQSANIDNEWKGIGVRRNLIAEQYQRSRDVVQAQAVYQLAQYDRATAELQTKMQDYDPQGTTALRAATTIQQIQAARGQALQAYAQKDFDNRLAAGKVQLDAAKAQQEAADKAAERKLTASGQYVTMRGQDITAATAAADRADKEKDRQAARDAKASTAWEERGLGDPATGEPFVYPEGQQLLAKAKERDAAGDAEGASALRTEAAAKYGVTAGSKEEAPKLQQAMAFTQSMSDKLAMIRAKLDADPNLTDRAAWGGIASWVEGLKIDEIKALGMNPSSRELEALKEQFGETPEDFDARLRVTGGQQKLRAKLDAANSALTQDVDSLLKANKVRGGWKPRPLVDYKPDPTPADALQAAALSAHPTSEGAADAAADTAASGYNKATLGLPVLGAIEALRGVPGAKVAVPILGATSGTKAADASRQSAIEQMGRELDVQINPAEAAKYVAALRSVAKDGITADDRELATSLLDKYTAARTPGAQAPDPDLVESVTSPADGANSSRAQE